MQGPTEGLEVLDLIILAAAAVTGTAARLSEDQDHWDQCRRRRQW